MDAFGQVAIGKDAISNEYVSIEFGLGNKGIVLPYVTNIEEMSKNGKVVQPGTIAMDATSGLVSYCKDSPCNNVNNWFKLSVNKQNLYLDGQSIANTKGIVPNFETFQQPLKDIGGNSLIGDEEESAPGVLVLSDKNKAMVLPKMQSPHTSIKRPAPGMMAYDTKKKQLAIFNGTVWSFWSTCSTEIVKVSPIGYEQAICENSPVVELKVKLQDRDDPTKVINDEEVEYIKWYYSFSNNYNKIEQEEWFQVGEGKSFIPPADAVNSSWNEIYYYTLAKIKGCEESRSELFKLKYLCPN